MKNYRGALFLGMVGASLVWLLVSILSLRYKLGEIYPEYSTLRTDADGSAAFCAAIGELPGYQVATDFLPLEDLTPQPRLLFILGQTPQEWERIPGDRLAALNAAVAKGSRLVIAFKSEYAPAPEKTKNTTANGPTKSKAKEKPLNTARRLPDPDTLALADAWGIEFCLPTAKSGRGLALRDGEKYPTLSPAIFWRRALSFTLPSDSPWQIIYKSSSRPVVVEKHWGNGSIVLLADNYLLSNGAVLDHRETPFLEYLLGSYKKVVFSEGALGVVAEHGLGHLASRYGLRGAAALCLLVGVLYIWRNTVSLRAPMPAAPDETESMEYTSTAGLAALLQRAVPPAALLDACAQEWRRTGPKDARSTRRFATAWEAGVPTSAQAFEVYNEVVRKLQAPKNL